MWTSCACYRVIPSLKLPCSCSSKWIATRQYRTEDAGVTGVGRRHLQSYIDNWPLTMIDIYTDYLTQGKTCDLIIYFLFPAFSLTSIFGWRQSMMVTKHPYSCTNQKTSSLRCEYWKLTMIDNNIPLLKSTMALCSTSSSGTTGSKKCLPEELMKLLDVAIYRKNSCISRTFLPKFWVQNCRCGLYTRPLLSKGVNWLVGVTNWTENLQ